MRIAYLCADRDVVVGGRTAAAAHIADVATALAELGAEVLLLPGSTVEGFDELPADVTVETLPELDGDAALADWLEVRLREFGADALYERLALHTAAGATVAQGLGIPHLIELNAPLLEETAQYRSAAQAVHVAELEEAVLSSADAVFAVTGPLARYASARGARHVEVLPDAVDLDRYPEPSSVRTARCVFLGALGPWQGADVLADGWRLLGREAPPLLVIGDGMGRAALEAVGAEVTGAVPRGEVPQLLTSASIGLAPCELGAPGYASPLGLLEYLAAGLAAVAGSVEGVREVVGPEHAVLVPPGDPAALAEAVRTLAADEPLRARLGSAGRELVAAHHTWERRARRILTLAYQLAPAAVA